MVLTVNPSRNPTEKTDDESVTSHFFSGDATNNFCLERRENILNMCVIGLSEKTNTDETKNAFETARNFAVANAGRFLGVQKAHWKLFCESFLKTEKTEK